MAGFGSLAMKNRTTQLGFAAFVAAVPPNF
jgi:hypothetical protein